MRYHGPYNRFLNHCFGDSFNFFISPQDLPGDGVARDPLDFIAFLIVFDADRRLVLIAEIKDASWASNAGLHIEADQQLRRQYDLMFDSRPSRLWGLNFPGTSVRVYHGDAATRTITPPYQAYTPMEITFFHQDSWKVNGICISSRRRDSIKRRRSLWISPPLLVCCSCNSSPL